MRFLKLPRNDSKKSVAVLDALLIAVSGGGPHVAMSLTPEGGPIRTSMRVPSSKSGMFKLAIKGNGDLRGSACIFNPQLLSPKVPHTIPVHDLVEIATETEAASVWMTHNEATDESETKQVPEVLAADVRHCGVGRPLYVLVGDHTQSSNVLPTDQHIGGILHHTDKEKVGAIESPGNSKNNLIMTGTPRGVTASLQVGRVA
eukprot:Blabericola_migrator_1__10011@NODE_5545_length_736_cov_48_118087_g3598_i0_p1_GENE_NODE_5545_length_736_cov_48_118087_g3598_i0NODE_5545_length_736_cov_48_118087_g3598_i0_p1_ORF_typecomplete_len202_score38_83_NODE_5545_length_736_cov_48_118087_g3598_i0103708